MKKKCLSKAILAAVLGGMFCAPSLALAATITGNSSDAGTGATITASKKVNNVANVSTTYVGYNFSSGGTVDGISLDNTKAYIEGSKKTLTISNISGTGDKVMARVVNGGDLQTNTTNATTLLTFTSDGVTSTDAKAYGLQFVGTDSQQSYGLLKSKVTLNGINGATGAFGLYADKSYVIAGTATALQDFAIGSISGDDVTYGISTTSGDAAAIYAINGSKVGVNSKLKAYVNSDGAVAKSGASVTLGGWGVTTQLVYVDKTNTKDYAALRAEGGTINVDMKTIYSKGVLTVDDKTIWGKQVNINGNLVVDKESGTTNDSIINLSLTNAASAWNGVAYKSFTDTADQKGEINVWLQNGATWTNELWGAQAGFNGSHITKLEGGTTPGIIVHKDTNPLTIDNYSGSTKVYMAHTAPTTYTVGNITITAAVVGSSIILITDNNGIDTSDKAATVNALNALAGKLYYTTAGTDTKLQGMVQIADGLTSSSASLKTGLIDFDTTTKQGKYKDPYKDTQDVFIYANGITGTLEKDIAYANGGVLREDGKYHLDGDTTITLAATGTEYKGITNTGKVEIEGAGHDLTLTVNGDATTQYGIKQDGNDKNIIITAKNLNLNVDSTKRTEAINLYNTDFDNAATMNINGNVNIYAHAGATALMGIHAVANTFLNIDGNLTIKNPNDSDGKWGTNAYTSTGATIGYTYFGNAAVYVHSGYSACQKSGGVNVTGDVDIMAQAGGLYINGGGGVINIAGGGKIEVDPTVYNASTAYPAMRAEDGYIYMNVTKDTAGAVKGNVTGAGNKKATVLGNLSVTRGADNAGLDPNHYESFINLGLNTSDSSWKGVAYNAYTNTETGAVPFRGEINVWLANGATWTNEMYGGVEKPYAGLKFTGNDDASYDGSCINKLVGGSSAATAGNIFQNDTNQITIDSYSGNTKVFYAYTNDGDEATDYAAGDIKIKSAADGSVITLVTDNSGIDTTKTTAVSNVLQKLANKLYYLNYAMGEKNLTGYVQMMDGLTSSSVVLLTRNLAYSCLDGKAFLIPEESEYSDKQIRGAESVDYAFYKDGKISKNDKNELVYTFDKDLTITRSADVPVDGLPKNTTQFWSSIFGAYGDADPFAVASNPTTAGVLNYTVDMQNHKLTASNTYITGRNNANDRSSVINMDREGTITFKNAGGMDLFASADKYYTSAIRAGIYGYTPTGAHIVIENGDGWENAVKVTSYLTDPTTKSGFAMNNYVVFVDARNATTKAPAGTDENKLVNTNTIDIKGLVDVEANYGQFAVTAWGTGGRIDIGGGKIVTKALTSQYTGTGMPAISTTGSSVVNFNVTKDADGKANGAGTNPVMIDGVVRTGTDFYGAGGTVNLGLNTNDSYLKGNIKVEGTASGDQTFQAVGDGAANIWMGNGAQWTGDGDAPAIGMLKINMTGSGTKWEGAAISATPNLTITDGAVFKPTKSTVLGELNVDGGKLEIADGFKVNSKQGTVKYAADMVTGAGKLAIDNVTVLTGDISTFFSNTTTTGNTAGSLVYSADDSIQLVGGYLKLTADKYTVEYLDSATDLLHTMVYDSKNSKTIVLIDGELQLSADKFGIAKMQAASEDVYQDVQGIATTNLTFTNTADAAKGKVSHGINVSSLRLIGADTITVEKGAKLTLGSVDSNVLVASNYPTVMINVDGEGSKFTLGRNAAQTYEMNGGIDVTEGATLEINGKYVAKGDIQIKNSNLIVDAGAGITINDKARKTISSDRKSVLVSEGYAIILDNSKLAAGSGAEIKADMTVKGNSVITGTAETTMLFGAADATLKVGADTYGRLLVDDTKVNEPKKAYATAPYQDNWTGSYSGKVFVAAPADTIIDNVSIVGYKANFNNTYATYKVVAGQNGIISIGGDNLTAAIDVFKSTGLTWGKDVKAALYVNNNSPATTAKGGGIYVNGSWTDVPEASQLTTSTSGGIIQLSADSIVMVDASCNAVKGSGTSGLFMTYGTTATNNTFKGEEGAKLYIKDAVSGTKYNLLRNTNIGSVDSANWAVGNPWFTELNSTVTAKNVFTNDDSIRFIRTLHDSSSQQKYQYTLQAVTIGTTTMTVSDGTVSAFTNNEDVITTLNADQLTGAVTNNGTMAFLGGTLTQSITGGAVTVTEEGKVSVAQSGSVAADITMNAGSSLTFDQYSGNNKVFFAHTEDGTSSAHYAAGDVTIKSAATDSVITLVTDNSGMDMTNNKKVLTALNALSGKLYYLAAKDGETDLSGVAMIAEGLTSSSFSLRTANISFYGDNGQGYIQGADNRFIAPITGDSTKDTAYVDAGVLSGSTYAFAEDTRIAVTNSAGDAGAVMAEKSLTIAAAGKKVSLTGAGSANSYGIKAVGSDADNALQVTVNARETEIVAKDGSSSNIGMYVSGNADVTVNSKLTMHTADGYAVNTAASGWDYYGASAIYAANIYSPMQQGGKITVTDLVDLLVDANGVFVNGGAGVVTLAGGSIEINKENTKHYAALRAENGTINMNINDGATAAGTKDVNIKGNVSATCGAVYYTDPGMQTTINLGLNTADSSWTGVAYNAFPAAGVVSGSVTFNGDINLWLANGATWTNEQYGAIETPYTGNAFNGSHVSKFVGGSTADTKGYIFQKDTNPLVIDNYSGNTKVLYEHNDALAYSAGYIRIVSAAADSVITLATDNTGIDMTKDSVVNTALNSLANKLYYTAFIAGEKNLTGNVEILQGLTSASVVLKSGEITFDGAGGQGTYQGGGVTPGEDPEPTVGSDKVITGTMADNSFLGDKVSKVEGTVIYDLSDATYSFKQMNAAADAKAVLNVGEGAVYFDGKNNSNYGMILNDGANVTINGNVNTSSYSTSYAAAGISMMIGGTGIGKQSNLIINGRVTMGSEDEYGVVSEDKHGAYSTYEGTRWTGAGINMNQGHGSKITITDGLTMYVDGHGIVTDPYYTDKNYADKDLAVINVNGITNIHVESGEDVGLYAFANFGGTININMKDGEPGKDKVTVYGNAIVMKDTLGESENPYFYRSGEINLALTTADSYWTGAVDNTGTNQAGDFNLYLQNGGTWDYQNASKLNGLSAETMPSPSLSYYGVYDGVSHVANLVGGASVGARGVIQVGHDEPIEVTNYSGNVIAIYEHDANNPTNISGGDIKIANAKVGSIITLSTDNTGVTSENNVAVLNALAGKLYYTADNKNLTGYVQIAEGLTAASLALYTGNIAFDSVSGQGSYTKEESGTIVPGGIGGDGDKELQPVEDENTKTYNIEESKAIVVTSGSALTTPENGKATVINNADTLILSSADPSSPVVDATNGNVSISGTTEITGLPGQTLLNVGEGKELKLDGVNLTAFGDGKVVEMTPGSTVSIGAEVDEEGKIVAGDKDVIVTGDIQNNQGTFNMALGTANSAWTGNYKNEAAVLNLLIDNLDAKWTGSVNGDVLNVNINRGTWVNTGDSSSTSGNFNLTAGGTKVAFLDMRNVASGNVTVDKFSGGMTIMYRNDKNNPTDIGGGDVTIKSAVANSVINLWTDGKGLDLSTEVGDNIANDTAVKAVLNALAAKLTYTNFATEGNITGSVGVGEGLTRPAASLPKAAELVFAAADAGKGSINESTFKDNIPHGEIVYGDSETAMMRGAKMAMASTAMIWRAENNDLMKRMGDLRLRTEDSGVWAKYYSGKNEYDNNGSFNNKYKAVQVGVDTKLGRGWLGGIAFSYDDGRSTYSNGGNGDNKVKSLAAYATKLIKDGQYFDLIAKVSHLSNEYTVYNDYGYSLNGDYKNFGMSLSAEYGKKFDLKNGFYITPAAELTVGRINSKSYDAYSAYYNKNLHVDQDAFNSAVGRLSVAVGKKNERATYYAKVGLAHEFAGGFDTTYSAPKEPTSSTSINFKDTWMELQLGGSVKLKNDATIYGTFGKTLGGDVKEKWRVDVGMLFTFNHISEFFGGKKKAQVGAVAAATPTANLTEGVAPADEKVYTTETAAVADANGDRSASVKVGDTEVGATMPAPKISKGTFMLDEYVVTASRTKQRITDATADISVVTRKEIEEMHMETVEEALRTVPGVQFNNYGGGNQINANISGLRINGSKDIAILVDGVKINAFQGVDASGYMYSSVLNNMNNIERIEVLRGAAGVLYGSNAKGGVINIITREIEENKTVLDGSIGSFSRRDYKINTMGKVGKMSYNLYQGTFHQGDVTDGNGDKWEGFTDTVNFGGKVAYKFDDKSKLTLDYSKIKSDFGGTDLIYNNFYNGKYDSQMLSVRHDWTIDKHWDNTFVYRKTDEKRLHKQEYFVGNVLKNTDTDYTYQFITDQVHFKNKYNDLVFGFEYTKAEDNITSGAKSNYTAHDIKNRAFFINEDLKIMKGVTLSGGIRNEKPDGFNLGSYTTKSYKLAWDPTKKDTIYAGRSEFFILPSMDQLFNKSWGNANLKPAQGRTESIGYNRKFDQNNFMTVNWFQTKEDTGYGYDDTKGKYVNTENGISRGWNAQYTCKLSDKWNFNLGWTHLYTHASGYDSYSFGYYPKDYATFGFNYECGKFSGGLNGFYYFRAKDDQNRRIFPADNYGVFNLSFNYKPTKGFKTYLKIDNIFNKFYAEHTDAGNDPLLTGTGSRKYYAMPGRAFMIGMEFTF